MKTRKDAELEQFKQEWFALAKKYAHRLNDETHFHATFFNEEKVNLEIKDNSHHKATPKFKIVFKDGSTIPEDGLYRSGTSILTEFIRYVGAQKVFDAGILTVGKRNIVSPDDKAIDNLSPSFIERGWWAITKTSNDAKKNTITEIIKNFGLKAEIIEEIEN